MSETPAKTGWAAGQERVPAAPLAEWIERRLADLERQGHSSPNDTLAAAMEVSVKLIYRWRNQVGANGEQGATSYPRAGVEDALHRCGVFMWEVFPDLIDEDITEATPAGQRRSLDRLTKGKPGGVYGKLTDEQTYVLHRLHVERGFSQRQLGELIWQSHGFATPHSAAMALNGRWQKMGLVARDRVEAVRQATTIHGLAPRDRANWTEEQKEHRRQMRRKKVGAKKCKGVRLQYPRKGAPCGLWAQRGKDYCRYHDPELREVVERKAAEAREKLPPS